MRTITAMFDSRADAENARARLASAGISEDDVTIHDKTLSNLVENRTDEPVGTDRGSNRNLLGDFVESNGNRRGEGAVDHHRYRAADVDDDRSLWDRIKGFFSSNDDVFAEGLRPGGYLLTAHAGDHDIDRAVAVLDKDAVVDEHQAGWRKDGWSGGKRRQKNDLDKRVATYDRSHWLA